MTAPGPPWQRLDPRMLLVHPVHELARQLPLLIGSAAVGSATGSPLWVPAAVVLTLLLGVARWFTTTYRIGPDEVQLRTGVLYRKSISVPRNRIRSVSTEARLLHRLLGLAVLRVGTGQEAKGADEFELDAVPAEQVPRLRAELLAESLAGLPDEPDPGRVLARWEPSWLRYSLVSLTGLATIAVVAAMAAQLGAGELLRDSAAARAGLDAAQRLGVAAAVSVAAVVVLVAGVLLNLGRGLLGYGNLVLRRDAEVLHLQHGLVRERTRTFDMRRWRGGSLREPLLVRALGGARLDAVMTGVDGTGEASLLLPPCPAPTANAVLAELTGDPAVAGGPLRRHPAAATRRRFTRALAAPVVALPALIWAGGAVPGWVWPAWAVLTGCCLLLAFDRARSLGHRVGDGWLVTRAGSLERRRHCIAAAGVIGWTVRQTFWQRRAGVATLVAATAAGVKHYEVVDVPAEQAWAIAAAVSPWLAGTAWARPAPGPGCAAATAV